MQHVFYLRSGEEGRGEAGFVKRGRGWYLCVHLGGSPDRRQAAQTKITRVRRHLGFNSIGCYNKF